MRLQVGGATEHLPSREVGAAGIKAQPIVDDLLADQAAVLRTIECDGDVDLTLRNRENLGQWDKPERERGIAVDQDPEVRGEEINTEAVRRADPNDAAHGLV
jgi:hypothetical protein